MGNTDLVPTDKSLDVQDIMNNFEQVVYDPSGKNLPKSPLWYAWHYLQVYSFWGLRLPNTEATLKGLLGIPDPAAYDFFEPMREAYDSIHQGAETFLDNVFPQVVELGNDLQAFAQQATSAGEGDGMFSAITDYLDGKDGGTANDAIELLSDLQSSAAANADKAAKVNDALAQYKSNLIDAQGKLQNVQKQVESDDRTSQSKIDELTSTVPGAAGSLATMSGQLKNEQDEYQQDVIVAATSPTYVWVFPVGTISAITVATVYGVRATEMLDQIHELQAKIDAAEATLRTAIESHQVQQLAGTGLDKASKNTEQAINYTTLVQNAWNGLTTQLGVVQDRIDHMTKETDQGKALAAKAVIKVYLKAADTAWGKILPPLTDLTANPYITVQSGEVSLVDFKNEVQKALNAPSNPANQEIAS